MTDLIPSAGFIVQAAVFFAVFLSALYLTAPRQGGRK